MTQQAGFDEADLNGFVDGVLEPARAAALAESLAADPEARARIDAWKRQNESLRTMFASVLFEPVPVRLLPVTVGGNAKATEVDRAAPSRGPSSGPHRLAGVVASTALGMGLVGFALGALSNFATEGFGLAPPAAHGRTSAEGLAAPAGLAWRAVETHQTYLADAVRPVEIPGSDEPRLSRWLQRRVAPALRIPDLRAQGWTLVGGRVVPGQSGPAAFLVYGSGPDRLGLYVAHAPESDGDATGTVDGAGLSTAVATWHDGPLGYAITTSRPGEWLERHGPALREAIKAQGGEAP